MTFEASVTHKIDMDGPAGSVQNFRTIQNISETLKVPSARRSRRGESDGI